MTSKKNPVSRKKNKKDSVVSESVTEPVTATVSTPLIQESAIKPEESPAPETVGIKRPGALFLVALVLGWLFDFLFWEQAVGINFPIFLTLCLLGGLYWLLSIGLRPAKKSLWLVAPFLLFAAVTFLRREPLTIFLAFTFTLLSIGLFATSYLGGRWILYGLLDYCYKFLLFAVDMIARPVQFVLQVRKDQASSNTLGKNSPIWGLLRGFVIALPIVLCFASLLASADLVFNQKLDEFFEDISENTKRLILIVVCAYFLIGVFLHSAARSEDKTLIGENKPFIKSFLGFTESAVILGSVSVLFLLFVIVQFQYFFGGENNIGVAGFTYSQYARRGFNELVIVAFFSLVMILGLSALTRRESELQKRIYSGLSVVLVVLVMIILVSAFQRIALGISWHGYSRLRVYPRIFLIWLGLLFITVVVLEIFRQERFFAFAALLASFGFAISLFLTNIDAAIIQRNLYRGWHGKNLNVPHLASLSDDAIPLLATEYLYGEMPTSTRQGIGAALACYRYFADLPHSSTYDWRSFNWSSWQAQRSLEVVRPYLAGYVIRYNQWPVRVRTPHGELYECELRTTVEED